MNEVLKHNFFSLTGLSLSIAVVGVLSSITTMFLDTSATISVKWLLFTVWLAISLLVIFLKVIFDTVNEVSALKKAQLIENLKLQSFEIPIKFISETGIFIIRKNEHFVNQIFVSGYLLNDEVENFAFLGTVYHIQDKFIQIKMIRPNPDFEINSLVLKSVIIRSVLPIASFPELLNNGETT